MLPNALLAAGGLLLVATLTPGPNNLVVLRTAATGSAMALWSAVGGIVLGGVAMLGLVVAGGSMLGTVPFLRTAVAVAGAAYLGWLGLAMWRGAAAQERGAPLPAGFAGLFAFQFLNPKGWVMVLSLVAAFPQAGAATTFAWLAPLFVAIPFASLLLWALAGRRLAPLLQVPAVRRTFDRVMGLALLASAALLLL